MLEGIKRLLKRSSASGKGSLEDVPSKTVEERRDEALKYLVTDYHRTKERREELRRRIERMGPIRRRLYKGYVALKEVGYTFKEIVIKPIGLALFTFSGAASVLCATCVMPEAANIIDHTIPFPFNLPIVFTLANGIVFSPFIVSFELYSRREMNREKKILRDDYGISI
jgi:hypothetical protein